ncbi:MAG: hypothetical protein WDO24_20700 [Pseudomonadota bacterium]
MISLRGIGEKGTEQEGKFREPIWIMPNDEKPALTIARHAARWAQYHVACFMIPAVIKAGAVIENNAKEHHVAEFTTLLVDLDMGDTDAKLAYLEQRMGAASMVVYSGGITDTGQPKRHAYWKLREPHRSG